MSEITDILEQQADLLFENVAGWETRTLQRIGKRIKTIGNMKLSGVKALNNMSIVKQDMDAIIKDLARVTGLNISEVQKMYSEAIENQHFENKALYDFRNKPFIPFSDNTQLQALVRAYSKSTGETMINLSKTKALGFIDEIGGFKNMQDSIYDIFGKATMEVATGTSDFNSAMRSAIERLGSSGVVTHYGSGVNRRLDTVIRQNILWGAKQASIEYNNIIGEELGCDGIEIDFHSNPRPSHEFMQGMQYSLEGKKTVNGKTYESADRALERLNDYGCLHYKTPIILGITEPRYDDDQLAEMRERDRAKKTVDGKTKIGYEWTQDMRRLETEARKEKDIINALKASGNEAAARQHRRKLRAINEKYNNICEQTGLTPQKERMRVYGNKNIVGNTAKVLKNSDESGKINYKLVDHSINIHNETENGVFDIEEIEKNLSQTNIGEAALKYIEQNNMFVTLNYDLNAPPGVCGEIFGRDITIYPNNCSDFNDVCGTLIHEVAHKQYDWGVTQEDEVNCYLLETIHKKGEISAYEIKSIVEHVRINYTYKSKGELYGF